MTVDELERLHDEAHEEERQRRIAIIESISGPIFDPDKPLDGEPMKRLTLNDAMGHLTVTVSDTGYEISSPAGTAQYDAWGGRTTVNGVPEYFPRQISVKQLKPESVAGTITIRVKTEIVEPDFQRLSEYVKKVTAEAIRAAMMPGGLLR